MDIKKIIEEKCNIVVDSIKLIGEGYDSKAYIVNNETIFYKGIMPSEVGFRFSSGL